MAPWQKVELKDVENPRSEDDWEPLVVGDMLHHLRGKGGQFSENDDEVGGHGRYICVCG